MMILSFYYRYGTYSSSLRETREASEKVRIEGIAELAESICP